MGPIFNEKLLKSEVCGWKVVEKSNCAAKKKKKKKAENANAQRGCANQTHTTCENKWS